MRRNYFNKLYEPMPRRMKAVIEAQGIIQNTEDVRDVALREWICNDLATINKLCFEAIHFFFAWIVGSGYRLSKEVSPTKIAGSGTIPIFIPDVPKKKEIFTKNVSFRGETFEFWGNGREPQRESDKNQERERRRTVITGSFLNDNDVRRNLNLLNWRQLLP